MDETAMLAIWFSSMIAGMLMTMIMLRFFTEPIRNGEKLDQLVQKSSEEALQRQRTSEVWIGRAA
jgi:uncharacterized membrane-anchored protein YhcB (DUF1043 family)